jgi:multimeric flavodoxin WrbA
MNVVCLLGSPRPAGNSSAIAGRFTETAAARGAAVRSFDLNSLSYRGCQGCYACKKDLDRCILRDDLTEVLDAVAESDLLVLASPVYYGDVTAQMKGFIDRTFSYLKPDYLTNPRPTRLAPGKKLVFILTQSHPDSGRFADIYLRYEVFLGWLGFEPRFRLRACGMGPDVAPEFLTPHLNEAAEMARKLVPLPKQETVQEGVQ